MFNLFKKTYFSKEEQMVIVKAIRASEMQTSGEIRLFIEGKHKRPTVLQRAGELFFKLKMDRTDRRNGVLIYLAMKTKQVAIFADQGIYARVGQSYWDERISEILVPLKNGATVDALVHVVSSIGETLSKEFPRIDATDRNELPDDIVFGNN
jgi:uncharacterized membrane protein